MPGRFARGIGSGEGTSGSLVIAKRPPLTKRHRGLYALQLFLEPIRERLPRDRVAGYGRAAMEEPRRARVLAFAIPLLSACYGSDFTPTDSYAGAPRAFSSVRIFTQRPPPTVAREVGIISSSGASYEGALDRAREQAAEQGCDGLLVLSDEVESGPGTPGSAYGMTRTHLRATCLVRVASPPPGRPSPPPPIAPPPPAVAACVPECRLGFDCVNGACVSACNPPCPEGFVCTGHGANASCVPPPPPAPPAPPATTPAR